MKVTLNNINDIKYIYDYHNQEIGKSILRSLMIDLKELNEMLIDKNQSNKQIYIDYENKHTEYSPERTDPCPDYYGMFSIRFEKNPYEKIGDMMTLNELDNAICLLSNFIEFGK